jgi:hypothetical protein
MIGAVHFPAMITRLTSSGFSLILFVLATRTPSGLAFSV